jgi:hypothetical protein
MEGWWERGEVIAVCRYASSVEILGFDSSCSVSRIDDSFLQRQLGRVLFSLPSFHENIGGGEESLGRG